MLSSSRSLLRALSPGPSGASAPSLRFLHGSAPVQARSSPFKTSRRELARDLTPSSASATYEVAGDASGPKRGRPARPTPSSGARRASEPERQAFVREAIPHPDREPADQRWQRMSGKRMNGKDRIDMDMPTPRGRQIDMRRGNDEHQERFSKSSRTRGDDSRRHNDQVRDRDQVGSEWNGGRQGQGREERQPWKERGQVDQRQDSRPEAYTPTRKARTFRGDDIESAAFTEREARRAATAASSAVAAATSRQKISNPLADEDLASASAVSTANLPLSFLSPPLLPGLLQGVQELVGADSSPTAIQALSLKHLVKPPAEAPSAGNYTQALLASETGSGKSVAYLMPVLQSLKIAEASQARPKRSQLPTNPRALILAPTHELARQLSMFGKRMSHVSKLRIQCASRANNTASTGGRTGGTARELSKLAEELVDASSGETGELHVSKGSRDLDVLVGTPSKLLDMIRGRGWKRKEELVQEGEEEQRDREWTVGKPEMGLERIEWVVVDEADVLFDPDFMESTRTLLADVSAARGHPVPVSNASTSSSGDATTTEPAHVYPFNIILSSATIPYSLDAHLNQHHPNMTRLVSPRLHRLPSSLKTEHVSYGQGGGNRLVDVERRLKAAWMTDGYEGREQGRVLIFVNKGTKVEEIKHGLESKGIKCIGLSGGSDTRSFGSNKHLQGFLKAMPGKEQQTQNKTIPNNDSNSNSANTGNDRAVPPRNEEEPRVLITTSLLSRGLDFSPDVRHVFILDNPRNMVDFLHRAGRSARAGKEGTVVLFGKTKGRGSKEGKDVRKKIGEYKA